MTARFEDSANENSRSAPGSSKPDTVATPEGDNEFAPDQPITPIPGGLHKPPAIDTNDL